MKEYDVFPHTYFYRKDGIYFFGGLIASLKIISYDQFYLDSNSEGLVAGTIMSIQEKKSTKGTPYAIIKFSDEKREFELFVFAEMLVSNREKLIECVLKV